MAGDPPPAAVQQGVGRGAHARSVRSVRLLAVLQRRRFAGPVASELTGGRRRRDVNGAVVVVAIGDAATRGGAANLRLCLRHLCWTVDVPEHTASQVARRLPLAAHAGTRGARGAATSAARDTCGRLQSRRTRPRRPAEQRSRRPMGAPRAPAVRAPTGSVLRQGGKRCGDTAGHPPAVARGSGVSAIPQGSGLGRRAVASSPNCAQRFVNRVVTEAVKLAWRTWESIRGRPCYPCRPVAHVWRPRVDWRDLACADAVGRAARGGLHGVGWGPVISLVVGSAQVGGAAADAVGAAPPVRDGSTPGSSRGASLTGACGSQLTLSDETQSRAGIRQLCVVSVSEHLCESEVFLRGVGPLAVAR